MATHCSILAWRIPMDRGTWWAMVHGVAKSQTQLSDFHLGFPHSSVGKESASNARDLDSIPGLGRSAGEGYRLPSPCSSSGKESTCSVRDLGSVPGLRRSSGGRHGNLLQYSCLENPYGQRSLVGYSPQRRKELDMTEWLSAGKYTILSFYSVISYSFQKVKKKKIRKYVSHQNKYVLKVLLLLLIIL